ncbi:hypothetical protein [Haloarcula salinisoli]|uniref:Uncharacterized protein n=1 Tax=Haloarcula salinisoli TaxID=2487746 RepID=A0A8J7YAM9_9EURY|nr:hypothetical protein [Halomicroarcula salinisoli]MBX0286454.1 hypothetical protein [Halomicroarcula salinisoli]MBX0302057.1 hypothetical protein [Halomicroarcula salinisoli]
MNSDDSLLVALGNIAVILVLGVIYVILLALGTAFEHAKSLLSRSATTASNAVSRVFARNRSA